MSGTFWVRVFSSKLSSRPLSVKFERDETCRRKSSPSYLRPLPSTTAGFRSTFDRLPYRVSCLLFMYRLDLTAAERCE